MWIVTASATCQKILSAFVPQSKSTFLPETDISKVLVVLMMNTSLGQPQKVMSSIDAWRQYVASKYAAIEIVPQGVCVGVTLSVGVRYLHIGNGLSQNRRCV